MEAPQVAAETGFARLRLRPREPKTNPGKVVMGARSAPDFSRSLGLVEEAAALQEAGTLFR